MFIQRGDFDNLLTLPACRQHRALFPIVNIYALFIEGFVVLSTEVANLLDIFTLLVLCLFLSFVGRLLLVILLLITAIGVFILLEFRLRILIDCCFSFSWGSLGGASSGSSRVDVGGDYFLPLGRTSLELIIYRSSACLSQHTFDLVDLGLTESTKFTSDVVAEVSVELNDAALSRLSDVLQGMGQSCCAVVQTHVKLVLGNVWHFS